MNRPHDPPAEPPVLPFRPLSPIRVEMTKWGGRPHWAFAGYYLGEDEHGRWLGFPAGTYQSRPGHAFDSEVDSVTLVVEGSGHLPTLYAPGIWCRVYVDITTDPVWDGATLRAVDLDLDVVRRSDGVVYVDDEDEFAEHRVRYGYPDEVIARAETVCADVHSRVSTGAAPYAGEAEPWLRLVADLTPLVER